jgi:hypothetical protein
MYERSSATYLWAAMTHLTPSALDILVNPGGGIRDLNTKIARKAIFLNEKYSTFLLLTLNMVTKAHKKVLFRPWQSKRKKEILHKIKSAYLLSP